ncbi:MAG: glycosyltransferase family 2 protein [Lachnospiraceae bacterium]|nr:glycosyltransferase family 2 protein [Lachnospiraceae bacterium]
MSVSREKEKLVSFVIPCYRSEQTLSGVVAEIKTAMGLLQKEGKKYDYEIILVNDCSPDDTFFVIRGLCREDERIKGINLAKNFGQHAALMAGFQFVKGDITVCLDDDGQTPADEVGKLLAAIEEGLDVVYAKYQHKRHSLFRNFGTYMNEEMARVMLGKPKELYVSSYFAARRFVIEDMKRYTNAYPYVIGLVLRAAGRVGNVSVAHREREVGASGYTFGKLLGLWFNGFTAFSVKPLRIATAIGCTCSAAGFLYGIYTVIKKWVNPHVPLGFSSLMAATVFMGGMTMMLLGLVGEYVGRMYISMNNSPQYVIREMINEEINEDIHKKQIS